MPPDGANKARTRDLAQSNGSGAGRVPRRGTAQQRTQCARRTRRERHGTLGRLVGGGSDGAGPASDYGCDFIDAAGGGGIGGVRRDRFAGWFSGGVSGS